MTRAVQWNGVAVKCSVGNMPCCVPSAHPTLVRHGGVRVGHPGVRLVRSGALFRPGSDRLSLRRPNVVTSGALLYDIQSAARPITV
jgi:hypothetical protein